MLSFFLQIKNFEQQTEVLPTSFDIITDSDNNINISLWFRGEGHLFLC